MLAPSSDLTLSLSQAVREAAYEAGALALPFFRGGAQTSARLWFKGGHSPVTEADIALDTFLKGRLTNLLPEAGWLSEETTDDPARLERRFVWIVDPIDGTRAFASGHPDWSISIALVAEGRPLLGVVHAPIHDRLYEAQAGSGAACNGQRLSVGDAKHPDPLRVAGPQPLIDRLSRQIGPIEHLPKVPSLALRLARVAEGAIDVGLVSKDSHDWDIAAADLILQEAGAVLTDFEGASPVYNKAQPRHGEMVAVASRLHPRAIGAMRA
ncbi:3'(2'),5'-bisphosphate nucleotidase CysQ [Microvirga terricola]|uniref:3'(2'),5'-bisphosphate nucleotidase CysQ n=1 Tax=Microvirga terricola TaxID=2719797 RepID=A0ABX0VFG1_9HYPH|nr:3'(2'),5'-bisphosphate nucleotidase CysQ [Microvirga terricola]NIX76647.1 3'(2'),5'-bisphosphate nucleotidase CysQ [Microvirga terricola]